MTAIVIGGLSHPALRVIHAWTGRPHSRHFLSMPQVGVKSKKTWKGKKFNRSKKIKHGYFKLEI